MPTSPKLQEAMDSLRSVLGEVVATSTATVLNSPSTISTKAAQDLIAFLPLEVILQDLGTIVAKAAGAELTARALRPADYAGLPDIPKMLVKRISDELRSRPETFHAAFIRALRIQG